MPGFKFSVFVLCLIIFIVELHAQNPCKTTPMLGYAGNCPVSMAFSTDGKTLYTTDETSLKVWDVATQKVTSEISTFRGRILACNSPGILQLDNRILYDVAADSYSADQQAFLGVNEKQINAFLSPESSKAFAKIRKGEEYPDVFLDKQAKILLVGANGAIHKLDLTTNQSIVVASKVAENFRYLPLVKTLIVNDLKTKGLKFIDLGSGKETSSEGEFSFYEFAWLSPDLNFIIISDTRGRFQVYDRQTFKRTIIQTRPGVFSFKTDMTGFFVSFGGYLREMVIQEYSLPDFKLVNTIQPQPWTDKVGFSNDFRSVNADKSLIYLHHNTLVKGKSPFVLYGYDIMTGELKDSLSIKYQLSAKEIANINRDREERSRIGNNAIEKLYTMKEPKMFHATGDNVVWRGELEDYTPHGYVLLRDHHGGPSNYILWKFPEGTPIALYHNYLMGKTDGKDGVMIELSSVVSNGFLSPDGKVVGFDTFDDGIFIYVNNVLKVKKPKKQIVKIFNDKALIRDEDKDVVKDLELIDLETGKTLKKYTGTFQTKSPNIDRHFDINKVVVTGGGYISIFDGNTMVTAPVAEAKKAGYLNYQSTNKIVGSFDYKDTRLNRATNTIELIPNYKAPNVQNNGKGAWQGRYILTAHKDEGFQIMDIEEGKYVNTKPLYSGWSDFYQMVYFEKLDLLLVTHKWPFYTKPNATEEDPGASAFTINIKNGEVTPYLITNTRQNDIALRKAEEVASWAYAPKSDCEVKNQKFPPGTTIVSPYNKSDVMIVLGYDCDIKVFAVAKQELYSDGGTYMNRVRIQQRTPDEINFYVRCDVQLKICPNCAGQPKRTHVSTYTGWTNWEQQNFNIYSRRYVENKQITEHTHCKECNGGWKGK